LSTDSLTVDFNTIFISNEFPKEQIMTKAERKAKFQKTSSNLPLIAIASLAGLAK
jgi:hypothetical protein